MTTTANKAIICYDNLLTSPLLTSVVATSEQTGYSVENCFDWYTTSYWSPTNTVASHRFVASFGAPITADYFAIYRHNLGTVGGTVVLEYSSDNATWFTAFTATTATDNELLLETFTAQTKQYWRVTFATTSTEQLFVGVVMFGQKLPLYRGMVGGFVVPRHGRKNEIINQRTEGGQFVGRIKTSQGARSNITFKTITQAWIRDYWEAFVLHAELKPFLFSWNHEYYPQDACYCVVDGEIPSTAINDNRFCDVSLSVQCLLSGDTL